MHVSFHDDEHQNLFVKGNACTAEFKGHIQSIQVPKVKFGYYAQCSIVVLSKNKQ